MRKGINTSDDYPAVIAMGTVNARRIWSTAPPGDCFGYWSNLAMTGYSVVKVHVHSVPYASLRPYVCGIEPDSFCKKWNFKNYPPLSLRLKMAFIYHNVKIHYRFWSWFVFQYIYGVFVRGQTRYLFFRTKYLHYVWTCLICFTKHPFSPNLLK